MDRVLEHLMYPVVTEQEEEEGGRPEGGEAGTSSDRPPQGPTKGNGQKDVGDSDEAQIGPYSGQGSSQVSCGELSTGNKQERRRVWSTFGEPKKEQLACKLDY